MDHEYHLCRHMTPLGGGDGVVGVLDSRRSLFHRHHSRVDADPNRITPRIGAARIGMTAVVAVRSGATVVVADHPGVTVVAAAHLGAKVVAAVHSGVAVVEVVVVAVVAVVAAVVVAASDRPLSDHHYLRTS